MKDINKKSKTMKTMKFIALLLISMVCFNACESDDSLTYIAQPNGEFTFSNSFLEEYVLTPSASGNLGERFTWDDADFDVETNINYELQKSITGDFTDMELVGSTSENEYAITIGDMLEFADEAGLDNDDTTTDIPNTGSVYFRLRASVGTDSSIEQISPIQELTLVLPESEGGEEEIPMLRNLYLVGDATAPGWDNNNNNNPLFRHADNENMYTYRGYFSPDATNPEGFKLLEVLGQWQPQWGVGANAGEVGVNDGTGSDPSAFAIAADGYYEFTLDAENMTYTLDEYDASSATSYTTIGIIGDSTPGGWDADTDMIQSSFDPHIWYINGVELNDGAMKFRSDNDWAVNWGSDTEISGFGVQEGADIPVTSGTYDIWFNDLDGGYIFIAIE